ncbi:MAG: GGDEF domain-containing phosphodiesterase [Clostridia bacterium]
MHSDLQVYFEILCNDSPNPCVLTELDTKKIIFMNSAFEKVHGLVDIFEPATADSLIEYEFAESHILSQKLEKSFRLNTTKLSFKDNQYSFCKYFTSTSYTNQIITFEEAMTKSVEILGKQDNFEDMTKSFLALVGEFYESTSSYVFYLNHEKTNITREYQWYSDGKFAEKSLLSDDFPLDSLRSWLDCRNYYGIREISKIDEDLDEFSMQLLNHFKVSNITVCAITDANGECIGVVGFSDRAEKSFDYRLLKTVTRFIQDGFTNTDMQAELKTLGDIDFLTGFLSRPKYAKDLGKLQNNPPKQLGVVFVNINGLRKTNEYMGFAKGDEQITKTAEILLTFFSEQFYRISGDEFVCFCYDNNEEDFLTKINTVHNYLKQSDDFPFSIGHAYKNAGVINVQKLVEEADTVMYINKQEYYQHNHTTISDNSDDILSDLLFGVANDEFLIYLQPQVSLKDDSLIGAEALIRRMDTKNKKMIFPDQFIPMYEQKSIIRHVDIFVLNKVCQMLVEWKKHGVEVPISVNLSRVTLIEYDIVHTIASICDNYGIPHNLITIEVTERIGLIENDVATSLIDEFKSNNFKVSLDDFGCAYSNIVTLTNISVDEVKIDKSLVDNLATNPKNRVIVNSIIDMCSQFDNTKTLAEGIEDEHQRNILRDFKCDYAQGYFYSRPIPQKEFFDKYIINK